MAYGVNAPFGLKPIYNFSSRILTSDPQPYRIYASPDGLTTQSVSIFKGDPVTMDQAKPSTIRQYYSTCLTEVGKQTTYFPNASTPFIINSTPLIGVFQGCEYTDVNGVVQKSPYWPGGTKVKAGTQIIGYVYDDPDIVYDVQVSTPTPRLEAACFPYQSASSGTRCIIGSNVCLDTSNPGADWVTAETVWKEETFARNPGITQTATYGTASATYSVLNFGGDILTGQSYFYVNIGTPTSTNDATADYAKNSINGYNNYYPVKIIGIAPDDTNMSIYNNMLESGDGVYNTTRPFLNVLVMINNHYVRGGSFGINCQ